jgi:HSP20 family protein
MLVPWDFRAPRFFENFRDELNQLMDQFFGAEDGGERSLVFMPRTNLAENEKEYEVTLDLPGLKPEDFNIEMREGQLLISGERKQEKEEKGKTYHRIERQYGSFRRVIPLPGVVDAEKIEAEYKDGVLRIRIPKSEAARPKRIPVKS